MKRGEFNYIVELVIALVAMIAVIMFVIQWRDDSKDLGNKEVMQAWILKEQKAQDLTKANVPSALVPPISILVDEPVLINTEAQLNKDGKRLLADAMVDCWSTFNYGKTNFLGKWGESNVFCFPCYHFSFDQKLKDKQIRGLNEFLSKEKPVEGRDKPTYLALLEKDESARIVKEEKDILTVQEDLFVYFFATSRSGWEVVWKGAATGAVASGTVGSFFIPPWGTVIGAAGGAVGGAAVSLFVGSSNFEPKIVIGDGKLINKVCNLEIKANEKEK